MIETYSEERLKTSEPGAIGAKLEEGRIIHFPICPIKLPTDKELQQLRRILPKQLKQKNISFHPEMNKVRGLDKNSQVSNLVKKILVNHSARVSNFLKKQLPGLFDHALVGTCSFRPIEERNRNLKPHASNELIHIDAGAYGATNGDRILRFFVNVNPDQDRVWATRGAFQELIDYYRVAAGLDSISPDDLKKGFLDNSRSQILSLIDGAGIPVSRVLDSSPYDRAMRKFHNFMKDSALFQSESENKTEIHFAPMSAWMVLTDTVSHACLSGQHCLNFTALIPLEDCQYPELAPYNLLIDNK
ncbi:MAG: Kdo hydroxylase family protein [Pseudomonadota bacterium]|nr:Kdo hydroxylase family protein [Pseudomonadota bacterium]